MNQQETEQLAALRMHVAHLHNVLRSTHATLFEHAQALTNVFGAGTAGSPVACMVQIERVLEESEPHVREVLAEADRDAKLVACRAELQSKADALAQVTARLARIETPARGAVEAAIGPLPESDEEGVARVAVLQQWLGALAEALK